VNMCATVLLNLSMKT